jgi:hypothetical protein
MRPTFRTLKVHDARALQALMAEHADSVEPGLKVLDERVLLGGGAVDLVALDSEGALVLVAVSFVADDAMLLRMLEAYAWCLEYPDTITRLYPASRTTLAAPPRVMFIGERLPDAFLRKVKHLRMPSIDCLEFRYLEVNGVAGLYFNVVEDARPSDGPAAINSAAASASVQARPSREPATMSAAPVSAAAPIAPVASPPIAEPVAPIMPAPASIESPSAPGAAARVEPDVSAPKRSVAARGTATQAPGDVAPAAAVEPLAASIAAADPAPGAEPLTKGVANAVLDVPRPMEMPPAELLEGLRMPETLSSQWRRVLSKTPDAPDAAKVLVVREFLQREFPGCTVYDFYEHQRAAQVFHLQNSQGSLMHLAVVSDDFFEVQAEGDIKRFLEKNRLARALRDAGSTDVLVTPAGVRVAKA